MTEAANSDDETGNEAKVQAGGGGARRGGGRGTRNRAGDQGPGGDASRYKPGQNVICKVGPSEYDGGYSVTVLETGDFSFLTTASKLRPDDEILAVFQCWSPVGTYNQYYTYPILALVAPAAQGSNMFDFEPCDLQKLNKIISEPGCGKQPEKNPE
jgi:hypothetical protein